jgi:hypothetical protein
MKRRFATDLIVAFGEDVIPRLLDGVESGREADPRNARGRHLSLAANATDPTRTDAR